MIFFIFIYGRLKCEWFMTDYEVAMRNALRTCFPESSFYACWFHFCQACKRHASQISRFVKKLRENESAMKIYYKFLCLPLLPADQIDRTFVNLKTEAQNCDSRLFKRFILHFETQWIEKVRSLILFSISILFHFHFAFFFHSIFSVDLYFLLH